jgi:hypothetical protein
MKNITLGDPRSPIMKRIVIALKIEDVAVDIVSVLRKKFIYIITVDAKAPICTGVPADWRYPPQFGEAPEPANW